MAENHDVMVRLVVLRQKRAAQFGRGSQQIEHVGGDRCALQVRGLCGAGERKAGVNVRSHILENVILRAPVGEIRIGNRATHGVDSRIRGGHTHQLARVTEGQWTQKLRVNHRENRGVRAYTQSQSKNRDGREAGILRQHANAIANVLQQRFHS